MFAGVCEFPARVKCASLAWHTMKAALEGGARPDGVAMDREARTLSRDVEVAAIPYGDRMTLTAGTIVYITQALGGSYTAMTDHGYMVRIEGKDADAIGETPVAPPTAEELQGRSLEELAWDQLKTCFDPEIPVNIVDLGLVYECDVLPLEGGGAQVHVEFTLTAPGCGMGDFLRQDVQQKLLAIPGVNGGRRGGRARPALGPEHDVRRRATAAGADVAMKLSSQEEYGLRCLLQLARAGEGASLTIAEMSEREGISAPNVAKIMRVLRRAGLVQSTRGKAGGYMLARPAAEIRAIDVLAALGGRLFDTGFCDRHAGVASHCLNTRDCSIRPVLRGLQEAVDQVLGALTLASLLRSEGEVHGHPAAARRQAADRPPVG